MPNLPENAPLVADLNTSICKTTFSWLARYKHSTRKMRQRSFSFFVSEITFDHSENIISQMSRKSAVADSAPRTPTNILLVQGRVPPPQLRALTRIAFHPPLLPVMEARPDNIAGVVASEFQVSGLFMFDQLSGSVSDLWNFVLHRLRDSASIGSLQLASAQQLDDMCKNVEARTALLFGLLSFLFVSLFLCVFLLVSWFVCLFVCFSLVTHVTSAGHIRSACHGNLTTSHHGVMSRHDVRCQLVQPGSQCCAMGCFGAYLTHVQTCDNAGPQSATQWTASAHILYTCPNLCDDICVQNAMLYILYTFPNL